MKSDLMSNKEYKLWLADLKLKVRTAQLKAAIRVNSAMLLFYWDLGTEIVAKQARTKWGDGFLSQLSKDLMAEFPDMTGFSERNVKYIRQWYLFYSKDKAIGQQAVAQLANEQISQQAVNPIVQQGIAQITQIPWGHNIAIISKCKNVKEALFYVQKEKGTVHREWTGQDRKGASLDPVL